MHVFTLIISDVRVHQRNRMMMIMMIVILIQDLQLIMIISIILITIIIIIPITMVLTMIITVIELHHQPNKSMMISMMIKSNLWHTVHIWLLHQPHGYDYI